MRTSAWNSLFALFVSAQGVRQDAKNMFDEKMATGRCKKVMVTFLCNNFIDWAGNEKCIRELSQPPVNAASCKKVVEDHETVGESVVAHPIAASKTYSDARNTFETVATTEDEKDAMKEDPEQTTESESEVVKEQAPEKQASTTTEDTEQLSGEVPEAKDHSSLKEAFYADKRTENLADWAECINMCEGFKEEPGVTGECDRIRSLDDCEKAQEKLEHNDASLDVLFLESNAVLPSAKNIGCQVVHRKKNPDRMVWLQKGESRPYNNVCGLYAKES